MTHVKKPSFGLALKTFKAARSAVRLDIASIVSVVALFTYIHGYVVPRTEIQPIKEQIERNFQDTLRVKDDLTNQQVAATNLILSQLKDQGERQEEAMRDLNKRVDRLFELLNAKGLHASSSFNDKTKLSN